MNTADKKQFTPWGEVTEMFPPNINPVRLGVYQIWDREMGRYYFDYWNGKFWSAGGWDEPQEAFKKKAQRKECNPWVHGWRGLAKKSRKS